MIMSLLGCQPTNDIIDIPTSGCGSKDAPSYSLETITQNSVKSTYVYARLTLNFVLCTFTEQSERHKNEMQPNSGSAYTSCQVLSL